MEKKLTPWFPPNIKPTRPGVYQVQDSSVRSTFVWYSHFDGERWKGHWFTPERAIECPGKNWSADTPWRGLAVAPKGRA